MAVVLVIVASLDVAASDAKVSEDNVMASVVKVPLDIVVVLETMLAVNAVVPVDAVV